MQTKLKIVLCIIYIMIITVLVIGCIYEKEQYKTIIHRSNETIYKTKQQSKEQLIEQKEQLIEQKEQLKNNINTIDKETDKEVDIQVVEPVNLGKFKLTAYCSCEECCGKWAYNRPNGIVYGAIGEELKEGYSIAVDPEVIPYRSEVVIDGKTYKAQDCGGAIKGNRIDIYFEDHDDALEFGVQYAEVFVNL